MLRFATQVLVALLLVPSSALREDAATSEEHLEDAIQEISDTRGIIVVGNAGFDGPMVGAITEFVSKCSNSDFNAWAACIAQKAQAADTAHFYVAIAGKAAIPKAMGSSMAHLSNLHFASGSNNVQIFRWALQR
mmetsp:Transcript_118612/g.166769  ORF Transcript_118612/g.166769 Transcript_118612/m.166769 type:complete len:134 (+) Transcript_118612:49-450(+)